MTDEEKEMLSHKIEWEGFDYCFADYSEWDEIEDDEFHAFRKNFLDARNKFITFLEDQGVEVEQ